jgi:hypothetical protein
MSRNKANVNRIHHKVSPKIFITTSIDGDCLFNS